MIIQYTILEKGNDVVALERGTFESGNKIEELEKAEYVDLDLEVSAHSPEQAVKKYKAGDLKVLKAEPAKTEQAKTTYKSKYKGAKTVASILEIFGWLTVAAGVIMGLMMFTASGFAALGTAIGSFISGLFLVGIAQVITAIVDIADNTAQLLSIAKNEVKS
jgi:hypothetical protein